MAQTEGTETLSALSSQMADAVARASSSMVTVKGRPRQPASGVVYAEGLVLTANHVVERDEDLTVELEGSVSKPATLVGRDQASDLALLKVEGLALQPIATAAGAARVGQLVLAVGKPSSSGPMASIGIVSMVGGPLRTGRGIALEQYIRTDATPYPGFSGGPLVDASGAILGITTTAFGQVALGIPHGIAWQSAKALSEHGTLKRGYIGISSQPVRLPEAQRTARSQEHGLLVVHVEENSPAASGGLMLGDILVSFGGQPVGDTDDLLQMLRGDQVGKPLAVEVIRGGESKTLEVTVGQRN